MTALGILAVIREIRPVKAGLFVMLHVKAVVEEKAIVDGAVMARRAAGVLKISVQPAERHGQATTGGQRC